MRNWYRSPRRRIAVLSTSMLLVGVALAVVFATASSGKSLAANKNVGHVAAKVAKRASTKVTAHLSVLRVSSGVPVSASSFNAQDQSMLTRIGATGQITRLDIRNGYAFYKVENANGSECYVWGSAQSGGLSGGCLKTKLAIPFLDFSIVRADRSGAVGYQNFQGIAVDGVSALKLIGAGGTVLQTAPVSNNVYSLQSVPQSTVTAIEAVDQAGNVVYSENFTG